ncbi:MAG TPA: type II toxin-antitoxin system PemK/MazF family toxin [Candidatus Woesearchaeota archaeon]|nr:type II toxin-antitoxin system PemK/MazF family toxin [Candidatus Woesearchaeota archaeon]
MEELMKGDVVVLPFPFSDLTKSKKKPALVVATLQGDDLILCQITSEARRDDYSIILSKKDFMVGNLNLISMIRPNRLFTADKSIILYKIGSIKKPKIKEVENEIIRIFTE